MKNIVLIGMPACGKSVTGVVLAKALRMKFIDSDLLIQEQAGRGLQEIINEDGIDAFKQLEEEVLLGLETDNAVIATGGSAVYYPAAMKRLNEGGLIVYIETPLDEIKKRLRNITTRGVAMDKNQSIDDLYEHRLPLYEKYADVTVSSDGCFMEETVADIISAYKADFFEA